MSDHLPIRPVLIHYGAEVPTRYRSDRWAALCCPFHGDTQASAAFNESAGRFMCHGCMDRSEDAIGLIQWQEDCGYGEAKRRGQEITGHSVQDVRRSPSGPSGLSALLG